LGGETGWGTFPAAGPYLWGEDAYEGLFHKPSDEDVAADRRACCRDRLSSGSRSSPGGLARGCARSCAHGAEHDLSFTI
jgi:hypothetical protein